MYDVTLLMNHVCCLFRREGGNDPLKARVASQRIPKRQEFQLAIAEVAWVPDCDGKLFEGEIFVANPGSNHRQILDHCDASERILSYRTKLHRTTAFAQRVFAIRRENPTLRRRHFFRGRPVESGAKEVTWLRADGKEMTIYWNESTKVKGELKEGETVHVRTSDKDGKTWATSVHVGKMKKKAAEKKTDTPR